MNDDNRRKLYDALSADYDMGTFEQFSADITDEGKRKKLYDAIKNDYDLPDFEGFSNQLGIQTGEPSIDSSSAVVKTKPLPTKVVNRERMTPLSAMPKPEKKTATAGQPVKREATADKTTSTGAKTPATRPTIGGIPAAKMPEGAMRFNSADLNNWKQRSLSPAKTVNRERMTPISEMPNPEVHRVNDVVDALRGDEEAAKRAGLDKAMQQVQDRIDYANATGGKELTGPIEDSEILAPTVGRDAEGNVITDAGGNPMTGVTNDQGRVNAQKYEREKYKQAEYNTLSAQMERAQQELEDLDKQLETPQTELGSMFSAPLLRDEKRVTLERARKQVEERIKGLQVEMAGGEQGFWKGLTDAAFDKSTWMFGLDKLADSARALRIANKMRNGEQITDEERALLEATMANQEVQQRLDDNSNFMYRAGRMTTEMVPFMIGIGATGGMSGVSGIGVNAGRRAMAAYARKYGTDALRHRVAEGMLQGTGALVGDLMAGVAMANTVGAANTLSDILDRRIGRLEYDPEGNPVFVGGKSWGESIYQGEVGQSLEYATEMMGAHILEPRLSRLVKFAGETGGLRGAARVVKGIAGNDTYKATANWLKRMGIQDIPSEGLEEEVNMLLGIGLHADDTDEQVRQFLDSDTHKEIWGGMGLSIAFMHGFGAGAQSIGRAYNEVQYARYKTKVDDASKVAGFRLGEDRWDAWKKKIDNTQNEDMGNIYTQVLDETSMVPEEKQAVVDYMQKLTSMRGYNLGRFRATQENASAVMPDEMAAHDTYNEGVLARGGERNAVGRQAREAASALNALPDGEGIGQEIDRLVNEDESYMVVEGYLNSLPEESRESARAYYLSAIRSKGVWDNAQEEVDNRVKDFEQSLAPGVVENEDGRNVMLANVQGAPALVVSDNGDTAIIYQNGRKRQVKSSEVRDVEIYNYDQYVNSYRQQEEQKATAEVEFALNNHANTQMPSVGLTLHEGEDTYQVTGINPSTGEVTATKVKLDKDGQLVPDGGAMVTLTEQEVLDLQNQYYEDLDARKAGLAAQPQQTEQPEAEQGTEEEPAIEEVPAADEPGTVMLEEQRNAVLAIDPEAQDLLDTIEWQINDYGVVAEGFWDSVPRELEEPLREYARMYAEAPVVEEAPEGEATVPAVEVLISGNTSDAQPTETELPRDKDGDLDIGAIRQTGDSQVMADALKAEFGDETANAVAQEYLTEAVKAQEKEKNPAKKMGSKKKAVDFWREVAGKLNVSAEGGSTAKATDTERADTNGMLQAGAAATEKWAQAEKIVGAEGIYTMDDGSDISGRYVLVEEGSTTPSHDPHTFNSSEGYPVNEQGQNANSRDYQNSPNAQASVVQMGNDYDGRALKDVPVVSADGIVWSGNNRTMSGMLAAENGRDGKYIESLKRQAARFGFTPEQIEGMQHPRVVFVPDEGQGLDYTPQTFNRFNAPSQKEEGSVEKGVKMGKVLSDHTFNLLQQEVARFGGLSGVFKSPNACREILRIMQEAAEIVEVNQQTLPRYITPDGLLTEEGQNLLESALVGYVFKNNPEVVSQIDKLPKRALNQLAEAMPEITANTSAGEYALMGELAEAIRTLVEQQASGQSLDEYMKQMDLFRENTLVAKTTEVLVRALDARTGTPLKDILAQYNDRAVEAASGQEDIFSDNSREGILRDVLGIGGTAEKGETAVETAGTTSDATQTQQTEERDPRYNEGWDGDYNKWKARRDYLDEIERKEKAAAEQGRKAYYISATDGYGQRNGVFHKVWLKPEEAETGYYAGRMLWTQQEAYRTEEGFQLGNIYYSGEELTGTTAAGAAGTVAEKQEPLSDEEVAYIVNSMKSYAVVAPTVEITDENWRESLNTPLGKVKMGANQRAKMFVKGRERQYGMLLETLINPDIVLEETDKEYDMFHERPSSHLFVKTFQNPDGSKYIHFESVTVSQDGMEVSISSHIIRENQLREKLKSDRLLYKATALDEPANSSAGQPINEGSGLSSRDKGTEKSDTKQEKGEKNVAPEKRDSYNAGERVILDEDGKEYTIEYITTEGEVVPGQPNAYTTYYHLDGKPYKKYTAGQLSAVVPAAEATGTEAEETGTSIPAQQAETAVETAATTAEEEYGKDNKLVSRDRYEELKKRMQAKLRGQANAGFDPEILAIGTEMAMFHVEAGARTFIDFAMRMINDLGDAIRPYLKAIYNGAKDMPGMEELRKTMTSYEGVMNTDVNGIGETAVETAGTTAETAGTTAEETVEETAAVRREEDADKYRAFSQSVADDMLEAMETGEKPYKSIVAIRAKAKSVGLDIDEGGRDDILLQELVEDGLVSAARQYVNRYIISAMLRGEKADDVRKSRELFDEVVRLYSLQPTISQRSTNRIRMQQYSTPLPMSFAADMFAFRERMRDVLEPTAGNGMLVFAIPEGTVHANELDKTRLDNLRAQKFKRVTDQDAMQPFEGDQQYDAVITNPPFGNAEAKEYDGKMIPGLAPQIALNALSKMKDNGKAVIIIGGSMTYGKNGGLVGDKQFFTYLYDHYNVKGVIDMDGKLYQKQGTTYPTRMILIDGRRSEADRELSKVYPPRESEALPKAETFDDLYRIVTEVINSNKKTNGNEVLRAAGGPERIDGKPKSRQTDLFDNPGQSDANDTNGRDRGTRTPVRGRSNSGNRGNGQGAVSSTSEQGGASLPGLGVPEVPGGTGNQGRGGTSSDNGIVPAGRQSESNGETGRGVANGGTGRVQLDGTGGTVAVGQPAPRVEQKPKEQRKLNQEKLSYRTHNTAFSLESVAPAAMVESMDASLSEIEKKVGSIDEFVRSELGYDTIEEAHNALAAEQMDSVAMAIYQMKKGNAMIIGDQTGVGKGRQMAALIRWAVKQGKKPVFITKDANLFSDIYRDLVDIGSGDLRPFIFNSATGDNPGVMTDKDGNVVYRALDKTAQNKVLAGDKLPDDYDYAVLSYSQVNTGDAKSREEARQIAKKNGGRAKKKDTGKERPTPKADFLRKIAKDNIMLLDESHSAAGESNTGAYLQSLVKDAKAVTFASATFAKRPDTMPLYAIRTAMSEANVKPDELIGIIEKGGVTLQEIMSRALSESGQMVRRERDMSDVKTDWTTVDDEATVKRARENYDRTIEAFNAIIQFQKQFVEPKIAELDAELGWMASSADVKKGTKNAGVDNPPFVNKTFNYTKQLLLALKVDAIVDQVEAEIKAGRHPVIALESTMESSLSDFAVGEAIEEPTFALSLLRGLDTVMQYTVKDEDGKETHATYSPAELGPVGEKAYYALQDFIRKATQDVFISPLDAIIEKLNERGYKVGELTGRKTYLGKDGEGNTVVKSRGKVDKKKLARDFNSGELDVLILNKSASTGISLHASEKFADQRQRTMIIAQPLSDINDYMQMIGRIDRTGQVHRGYYINLGLPVPAESRFLMMLATKLKSLNANTTTSQESKSSDVEAPDLLNKYGSQVVIEYLRDNPEVYEKMGQPLGKQSEPVKASELEEYSAKEDDANRITGRVALLSTAEQDAFYDDVVKRYNDLIKYLDETGTNDLKITVLPLRAKTARKKVSSEGADPKGRNPFAQNAYVEEVEMDVLRKPMKADEIRKAMVQLNKPLGVEKGHMRNAYQDELAGERVLEIVGTVEREREAKLRAEDERYDREKSKAEDSIRKRTEKINANTKASEAEKREAIETYAEEQHTKVDEDHERRVNAINNYTEHLTDRLGWFFPGQTYLVPDDLNTGTYMFTSPAIFCGYRAKESKVTPSTTFAVFATLDGRRRIEVKISDGVPLILIKGATDNNLDTARRTNLDNWDSQRPTNTRKKGYIMTGNILQAVADTQDQNGNYPGQLISFTDENGEIRDGILMPDKWEPGQLKTAGAPILSRIEHIKKLRVYDGPVVSTDGKVQIKADYGGSYHLRVPKSKKEGGQYFLNDDLLALVEFGEFYQRAGMMQADVEGDRIEDVVKLLSQMGVRVSSEDEMEGTTADATGAGARFSAQRQTGPVDVLEEARSMAAEDERRKPPREHAKAWEETVGVKINLVEREGEIRDAYVLEALRDGEIVKGWFNPRTGEVYLYLPNIKSNGEIDQTILHEVIAHKGLRELLGEREFNRLCDLVFDAMPEKDKKAFLSYPGADKLSGLEAQRAAADEYMAHVSETLDIYPSVWKRIVEAVRRWLRNRGLNLSISDGDIETVLRASLNNLMRNASTITTEEGTRMMVQEQSVESGEAGARFRVVTDPYEIARLNSEPTVKRYRAMAQIDGKLYPPMSVKVDGEMRPETPEGVWEVSEEIPLNFTQEQQAAMDDLDKKAGSGDVVIIPDKVRYHKDGKTPYNPETGKGSKGILQFKLVKDEGTPIWAAYNPYFHTSTSGLNDQFTSAYKRPNLVVVEVEIPESELTAGHRSAYAKDAVGDVDWKSGVVNNALPEGRQRIVTLSRWARVSRVVPDAEVADMVASQLEGSDVEIPFNVVTPSLRDELVKRGIKIGEPTKGNAGKAARTEYEAWKKGETAGKPAGTERRSVGSSLWNDSPEVLNYGRPGIGVKYGLRGVSNHQYIRSAEDVRLLAEMLPKKYAEQLRKYYLDGTTKGYYSPALDMVIVFAEKSPNIIEAELTEWHEQTHAVYEHLDMPDKEECANELLEYMKTEYPDTYEHITGGGRYIPKYWGNEALAYFVEDYIKLYGVENFLRLQFGGNEKISKLVAEIQKAFINGNEQKGPEAGHKEPSKRDGGGRNEAENNNSDRPYQGRTGLDGRGSRTETGRVAGESAETSGRAGEVESGGVGRIQASSSATPSSGIGEEHRSIARNAGLAQAEYDATVSGFAHRMRETWQDSMLSLKRLQDAVLKETGGRLLDSQNAWMAENRLSSSNAAQQEEFRNTQMAALVDAVAALGGADKRQYERIKKYMIAKHGLERNIVFAERDAREAAGADSGPEYDSFLEKFRKRDYSGLTGLFGVDDVEDAEDMARDYVDRFEDGQDEEIADLWNAVRGVSGFALQKSLDSGMISQEIFDTLRAQFENYIPLRGWDETTSDEVYDYIGRQVAGVQDIMKHAKGRKSVADDPLATLQNLAESAIIIGNRNMVKQHFLNLATMHKTSLVSVSPIWLRYNDVTDEWEAAFPAIDDNDSAEEVARKTEAFNQQMESLAQFDPDHYKRSREKAEIPFIVRPGSLSSHQVLVKQGGRTYVLTVNGNPRAAEAVNGLTNPDAEGNAVMKAVSAGSRWIASWSTAKNVGFIASNLVRDGLYTGPMAFIKEGGAYGARYTANWWACAMQLPRLLRMLSKDPDALKRAAQSNPNSLEGMFYDFVHNGGETGYTIVSDVEDCKKYIEKELRGGTIRKPWDFLNEILQFLGRWSEGVGRFAAYRTSREMGRSKARAIYDAKDISVNFSKKGAGKSTAGTWEGASARNKFLYTMGSMSQMSRAFYSFFNASVQGLENIARASWHNKGKAMGLFGGLMAMGAGQAYINELLKAIIGGDDDDDYYNLPEWQRSSNIILYLGKYWPGGWLKLPLPIEFGVPFGLGGLFAEYANDSELMSGRRFGLRFAQQLGKAMPLDPTSEDTYFNTTILWPTALKPIAEVGENRSWTGLPIANQTEWNKRKPEYQRVYSNAGKGYVGVSRALSELTGGTPGRRGAVEINPQKMQYLIKQYLSGGYNWFERPVKIGQDLTGEKDFEWQDVPVLYRFTTKTDQKAVEKRINSQFFDLKDEMDGNKYERDTYVRAAKASQNDALEYAKAKETLEKYEKSRAYTEYMIWHMGDKQLQKIREQGKEGEDVEENEYMLKQQMIDAIRTYRKTRDENKAIDVYPQKTTDKADRKEDE